MTGVFLTGHKQILVSLKCGEVAIDEELVSLVIWLDSLSSVHTLGSCQGSEKEERKPFIHFVADLDDIIIITKTLDIWYYDNGIVLEVGYNPVIPPSPPPLKYTIRFNKEHRLRRATKDVKKLLILNGV